MQDSTAGMKECLFHEDVLKIQSDVTAVHVSDALLSYVQDILEFTRTSDGFHVGLSPRAGLSLLQAARSWAYVQGRDYVLPEDVQKVMPFVVGHRLRSAEDREEFPRSRLMERLKEVPIP